MIKSILIPTDGSPNSMISLDYGIYLAGLFKAEITGLNVVDVRSLEGPFLSDISGALGFTPYSNYVPKFEGILEGRADLVLEAFRNRCREQSIEPKLKRSTGVISNIIAEHAKKVDLVIISQRGEHEKWSTGLLGSTTESVVRKSPRPVLVTPESFRPIENVLIAYDGSTQANKAMKTACELQAGMQFRVIVAFVTTDAEKSSRLAEEVEEFIGPYEIPYEMERLEGDAAEEIVGAAEQRQIDLIVMGAFGHGRLYDLFLGGTTAQVLRNTNIPVLLNR